MKYNVALSLCGIVWTAIAFALSRFIWPIWAATVAGIATAFILGSALRPGIQKSKGLLWFLLPLCSVALGSFLFGALLTAMLWAVSLFSSSPRIQPAAILVSAYLYAYISLTYYLWATYPASLVTHYLLRRFAFQKMA